MKIFFAPLCALPLVLAGCSPEPAPAPEPAVTDAPAAADTDPSQYTLEPVTEADAGTAGLPAEPACTFATDEGTILIAKAFAEPSVRGYGIVKINSFVEKVQTPHTGGFAAMENSGEFTGRGLMIDVETTDDSAEMTVKRAGAEPKVLDGTWTCGA